ncbi:FG-GAP repeat protein [Roseibacillus ishigakijimensis]|uniref:FG-GAP repeat protein n=1 Tax=Roseibacillus ishigakijimensis TaxID=454146 RepID=A0A934VL73_9BACT|nr:FG-GAP repeat protein [Roseibacillus ishigakijimensis]MBK1832580.1 FG-GAP repeat protein [Roseibacillus ishigakijimensis]
MNILSLALLGALPLAAAHSAEAAGESEFFDPAGSRLDRLGQAVAATSDLAIAGVKGNDDLGSNAGAAVVFDLATGTFLTKLTAPDGAAGDAFGSSVAAGGEVMVVGAPDDDDAGQGSGSAWLFSIHDWENPVKLTAPDGAPGDAFGNAVATDGQLAVVAAWKDGEEGEDLGSVHVFNATTGTWLRRLEASDGQTFDQFGASVAVANGLIAVGTPFSDPKGTDSGAVYLFDAASGQQLRKITAPDGSTGDAFGGSLALSQGLLVVGASNQDANDGDQIAAKGQAYLFQTPTGNHLATLADPQGQPGERFGISVAIGEQVVVGADMAAAGEILTAGAVLTFSREGDFLARYQRTAPAPADFLGQSVALGGDAVLAGTPQADTQGAQSGSLFSFSLSTGSLPPELALTLDGEDVILTWAPQAETSYTLWSSPDLVTWQKLAEDLSANSYRDTSALSAPQRFYRLTLQP